MNYDDKYSNDSLHEAVECSDIKVVKSLINADADVNAKDEDGRTPLHFIGNADIINQLIEAGADVHAKDNFGKTPLFYCGWKSEGAEALIHHGADVNAKDKYGKTPLHECNYAGTAEVLIQNGADVNAKDKNGKTPLDLCDDEDVEEVLTDNGAVHGNELDDEEEANNSNFPKNLTIKMGGKYGGIKAFAGHLSEEIYNYISDEFDGNLEEYFDALEDECDDDDDDSDKIPDQYRIKNLDGDCVHHFYDLDMAADALYVEGLDAGECYFKIEDEDGNEVCTLDTSLCELHANIEGTFGKDDIRDIFGMVDYETDFTDIPSEVIEECDIEEDCNPDGIHIKGSSLDPYDCDCIKNGEYYFEGVYEEKHPSWSTSFIVTKEFDPSKLTIIYRKLYEMDDSHDGTIIIIGVKYDGKLILGVDKPGDDSVVNVSFSGNSYSYGGYIQKCEGKDS